MQYRALIATILFTTSLAHFVSAVDYNFNIDDGSPAPKGDKKKEKKRDDREQPKTDSPKAKKDTISTADVFELFKGEQKVAIVSKKEERIQDAPATIYVVGEKEIKERGYLFLHDLLRDLPGIDFINDLGTYGMMAMQRGIDSPENNKTLIFIDGVLTNNPSQGVSYMSYQFALHNVKRVEVLWGPASALYGANAFAGIINIVTKTADDLEAEGKLGHVSAGTIIPRMATSATPAGMYFDFLAGGKMWEDQDAGKVTVSGHYIRSDYGPDYGRHHNTAYTGAPALSEHYIPMNTGAMPILGDYNAQIRFDYKGLTLGARAWYIMSKQGGFATYNWSATELAFWGFQGQEAYAKYNHKFNQTFSTYTQITLRAGQLPEGEYGKRVVDADRSAGGENNGGTLLWYKRNDYAVSADQQATFDWNTNSATSLGVFGEYARVSNWNTNDTSLRKWDGSAFVQRYPNEVQGTFDGNEKIINEGIGPQDKPEVYFNQYNAAFYAQHAETLFQQLKITAGGRGDLFMLKGQEGPEAIGVAAASTCSSCNASTVYTDAAAGTAGAALKRSNVYYTANEVNVNVFSINPRIGLVYNPNPKLTVKLLHGWAFRNPTVRERFSLSGSRIPIGANLKPEQIKTTEVGVAGRITKFLRSEVDFFWSEAEDLIQLSSSKFGRPGSSSAMTQFQNIGSARLLGFELKTDVALCKQIRSACSYLQTIHSKITAIWMSAQSVAAHLAMKMTALVIHRIRTRCRGHRSTRQTLV
ncbi:MAG: TonB-dependent receptor [Turneriella sp.]